MRFWFRHSVFLFPPWRESKRDGKLSNGIWGTVRGEAPNLWDKDLALLPRITRPSPLLATGGDAPQPLVSGLGLGIGFLRLGERCQGSLQLLGVLQALCFS